jgi:hypothetical protein
MLALRRPPLQTRSIRLLHATPTIVRTLVGPPDPVSNLRPVIYEADNVSQASTRTSHTLPYSDLEYQWRLHREQLDAFNLSFWTDVRCVLLDACPD